MPNESQVKTTAPAATSHNGSLSNRAPAPSSNSSGSNLLSPPSTSHSRGGKTNNIGLIAKREYLEQVRGKAFKLTTILVPCIFIAIFGIGYLAGKNSGTGKHLVIAAADPALANQVKDKLMSDPASHTTVDVDAPATDRENLIHQVTSKQIDGFLWLEASPTDPTPAEPTTLSLPAIS